MNCKLSLSIAYWPPEPFPVSVANNHYLTLFRRMSRKNSSPLNTTCYSRFPLFILLSKLQGRILPHYSILRPNNWLPPPISRLIGSYYRIFTSNINNIYVVLEQINISTLTAHRRDTSILVHFEHDLDCYDILDNLTHNNTLTCYICGEEFFSAIYFL